MEEGEELAIGAGRSVVSTASAMVASPDDPFEADEFGTNSTHEEPCVAPDCGQNAPTVNSRMPTSHYPWLPGSPTVRLFVRLSDRPNIRPPVRPSVRPPARPSVRPPHSTIIYCLSVFMLVFASLPGCSTSWPPQSLAPSLTCFLRRPLIPALAACFASVVDNSRQSSSFVSMCVSRGCPSPSHVCSIRRWWEDSYFDGDFTGGSGESWAYTTASMPSSGAPERSALSAGSGRRRRRGKPPWRGRHARFFLNPTERNTSAYARAGV